MAENSTIDVDQLPDDLLAARGLRPQPELTEDTVKAALRRTSGNRSQAAQLLGVGRTSLWRAMARLKIS
jgi:transcriptional regulator of acetoin/glycerol metabolism